MNQADPITDDPEVIDEPAQLMDGDEMVSVAENAWKDRCGCPAFVDEATKNPSVGVPEKPVCVVHVPLSAFARCAI